MGWQDQAKHLGGGYWISYEVAESLAQERDEAKAALDDVYRQRNALACLLANLTDAAGPRIDARRRDGGILRAGWRHDHTQSPEWQTVVMIDLPTGQISFHVHEREAVFYDGLPAYRDAWDGHTDEEKWARVRHCLGGPEAI